MYVPPLLHLLSAVLSRCIAIADTPHGAFSELVTWRRRPGSPRHGHTDRRPKVTGLQLKSSFIATREKISKTKMSIACVRSATSFIAPVRVACGAVVCCAVCYPLCYPLCYPVRMSCIPASRIRSQLDFALMCIE